jgi:hypothetical protein
MSYTFTFYDLDKEKIHKIEFKSVKEYIGGNVIF